MNLKKKNINLKSQEKKRKLERLAKQLRQNIRKRKLKK